MWSVVERHPRCKWFASGVALLIFSLAVGAGFSRALPASTRSRPAVELRGDREWHFEFGPVYRRFSRLELNIDGLRGGDQRRLVGVLERFPFEGETAPKQVVVNDRLGHLRAPHTDGTVRAQARLGDSEKTLPVGRYRLTLWLEERHEPDAFRTIATKPLFVIFNAPDRKDRDVRKAGGARWLTSTLGMAQLVEGELEARIWSLDIHNPYVFAHAIWLVDGTRCAIEAAERLVDGVCEHVDGYWPELADTEGQVPADSPPQDPDWQVAAISSAAERIRSDDTRGQCFDYTMLYVALLRSIGIPSRAVTSVEPQPMPHPYDAEREVEWYYHVWAEVYLQGEWLGSDVAYLDEPVREQLPEDEHPNLLEPDHDWFASAEGPRTEVLTVEGEDRMQSLSSR